MPPRSAPATERIPAPLAHLRTTPPGAPRHAAARALAAVLREHLFADVLPFWETHARDPLGGLRTCLAGDGRVVSGDKWGWSQWRAVWVFARLYHTLDRDPRWLAWAQRIAGFYLQHGWLDSARGWALVLAEDGRVLRGHESTYTDSFAVYGLQELFKADGDARWLDAARRTADAALALLAGPRDRVPHFPYGIPPGARPHGIPMLWSLTLAELGATAGDDRYLATAAALSDEIFRDHVRPARDVMFEFVRLDGGDFPGPEGNAIVPGHAIEDMWFQWHVAQLSGRGRERAPEMFRLMARHFDLGWDRERGGLYLAVGADPARPVGWAFADTKLWWPHTEALYGALLAWRETGSADWLEWYAKTWDICDRHFVDRTHGEWRQKLDRDFRPIDDVVALPVKDPFHLPRSLILQIELLESLPA